MKLFEEDKNKPNKNDERKQQGSNFTKSPSLHCSTPMVKNYMDGFDKKEVITFFILKNKCFNYV